MARRRDPENLALSKRLQVAFGLRLQKARRSAKQGRIQQEALAAALNVSRTTISNIERGQHRVFLDQVYVAARALGVAIDELLPALEEVFPTSSMLTAPDAKVTAQSVRQVGELAREIQVRSAREELSGSGHPSVHGQKRR